MGNLLGGYMTGRTSCVYPEPTSWPGRREGRCCIAEDFGSKSPASAIGVVGRAQGDRADLAPLMPICEQRWPLAPFFLPAWRSAYRAGMRQVLIWTSCSDPEKIQGSVQLMLAAPSIPPHASLSLHYYMCRCVTNIGLICALTVTNARARVTGYSPSSRGTWRRST